MSDRRVRRLEAALNVQLLHRTTRRLSLTEAGKAYFARVSSALETLDDAAHAAAETREQPRGTVRISAPLDVGAEVLPGLVTRFLDRFPEMRIEVRLSPEKESLQGGGFDLAIRGGQPDDTVLACDRLQTSFFRLYAAPAYIARAGHPQSVAELGRHQCLLFDFGEGHMRWDFGEHGTVSVNARIVANELSFLRRALVGGAGIGLLPSTLAKPLVVGGQLVPVLPPVSVAGVDLWLLYDERHLPLKVRVLRDFLLENFPQ